MENWGRITVERGRQRELRFWSTTPRLTDTERDQNRDPSRNMGEG